MVKVRVWARAEESVPVIRLAPAQVNEAAVSVTASPIRVWRRLAGDVVIGIKSHSKRWFP